MIYSVRTFPVYNQLGKSFNKVEKDKGKRENSSLWEKGERTLKIVERETWEKQAWSQFSEHQSLLKCNWVQVVFEYLCPCFMVFLSSSSSLSGSHLLILAAMITFVINSCPTPLEGDSVNNKETEEKTKNLVAPCI